MKYTESQLNSIGDKLADALNMKKEQSRDSEGRIRWVTDFGTKTGVGLIRTLTYIMEETNAGRTLANNIRPDVEVLTIAQAKNDCAIRLSKAGITEFKLTGKQVDFGDLANAGAIFVTIKSKARLPIGWKDSIFGDVKKPSEGGYIVKDGNALIG